MKLKMAFVFLSFVAFSCKNNNADHDFDYVKLKDFKFTKAELKPLSEIELLSVSGGKQCTGTEIYFYQFVGIDKATGDTVRILSPCQTYDEVKAPRTGTYIPMDDSPEGINKFTGNVEKGSAVDSDHFFVVINKKHFTETRNYKTVIGGIGFKD